MSTEAHAPDLPQINIFVVRQKGTNELTTVMTTLTIHEWLKANPSLQLYGDRCMNALSNLSHDDQLSFLQLCKIPAMARALNAIATAFSNVTSGTLKSEIEASDTRVQGKLALDLMLKLFGREVVQLLVGQYTYVYPLNAQGVNLERDARAEAPPAAPGAENEVSPPPEEPRVLRPEVAETVSEDELVRSVPGEAFRVEKGLDPSLIDKLREIPES